MDLIIPSGRSLEFPPAPRSTAHTGRLSGTEERIIDRIFGVIGRKTTRNAKNRTTRIAQDDATGDIFVVAIRGKWRGALTLTRDGAEVRTYDPKTHEARVLDVWPTPSLNGSNSRTTVQPWSEREGLIGDAREFEGSANFSIKARLIRAIAKRMSKRNTEPS